MVRCRDESFEKLSDEELRTEERLQWTFEESYETNLDYGEIPDDLSEVSKESDVESNVSDINYGDGSEGEEGDAEEEEIGLDDGEETDGEEGSGTDEESVVESNVNDEEGSGTDDGKEGDEEEETVEEEASGTDEESIEEGERDTDDKQQSDKEEESVVESNVNDEEESRADDGEESDEEQESGEVQPACPPAKKYVLKDFKKNRKGKFLCPLCNYEAKKPWNIGRHMNGKHNCKIYQRDGRLIDFKPHKCRFCKFRGTNANDLKRHLNEDGKSCRGVKRKRKNISHSRSKKQRL